jgi:hypothetical protein
MKGLGDAIGFAGMKPQEIAEYLQQDFKTKITVDGSSYVSGIEIVQVFQALEVPVDEEGFVNNSGLLSFIYEQLGIPDWIRDSSNERSEEVINALLSVNLIKIQKTVYEGERSGYVPTNDKKRLKEVIKEAR